jgi:lysophospholipase L1-like esterase
MTTIAAGNHQQIYFDHLDDIVITPGSGGTVKFDCSTPNSAATRPTARIIYSAATISIPAGSTVFLDAVGADATYTTDAGTISYSTDEDGVNALDTTSKAALGASGFVGTPDQTAFRNFKSSNTSTLRRIVADARAGYARSRLGVFGMSTEAGAGSLSGTLYGTNNRSKSWPMLLASILKARGINASADYIVGGGNKSAAALPAFDSRVSFTNTAESLAVQLWGGPTFQMTATTGQITFTPANPFDRIMIASASSGGNSVITAVGNGGATSGTLNTSGAAGVVYADNACSAGSTVATLTCGAGGGAFPFLIGTRDSTKPGIEVINAGWGASGTPDWNSAAAWNCNHAFDAILDSNALNCSVLCLDINDAYFGVAQATYRANLDALLTKLKGKGDVIVRISPTVGTGAVAQATQDIYWAIAIAAAEAADVPYVDLRSVLPLRAASLTQGIARDDLHETARGYAIEAEVMARALTLMV